ncbi:hypothetical protein CTI12_AA488230 [Artemisia annua]|uniref:Uncharacterized protein n=1 Tax=Artemisia annua TaxID=35608 RepID=A0A2U1LFT1_ARTAN|nr:hypothetical protein CTI12_AA488230 [Artemisia annua]
MSHSFISREVKLIKRQRPAAALWTVITRYSKTNESQGKQIQSINPKSFGHSSCVPNGSAIQGLSSAAEKLHVIDILYMKIIVLHAWPHQDNHECTCIEDTVIRIWGSEGILMALKMYLILRCNPSNNKLLVPFRLPSIVAQNNMHTCDYASSTVCQYIA